MNEATAPPDIDPADAESLKAGRVRVERIRLLYTQSPTVLVASLVVVAVAVGVLRDVVDALWLLLWAVLQVLVITGRMLLILAYRRQSSDLAGGRGWLAAHILGAALAGMLWGALAFVLDPAWPAPYLVMVYIIWTGVMVGGIPSNAVVFPAYLAFMAPIMAAIAGWPLLQGDTRYTIVGACAALLSVMILIIARAYNAMIVHIVALRIENADLAAQLLGRNEALSRAIRERERTEDELQRERQLFLEGPVILFRCAAEDGWPIEYISPNVIQFGLDFETLVEERTPVASLIHPDDLGRVRAAQMSIQGLFGMPYVELDYRLVLPDKRVRWVYNYIIPVHDGDGNVSHYEGYLLDITTLKATERALAREKERAQVTLYSIGDAVITTDVKGRIETMNPVAEQLTGWRLREVRSKALRKVYAISDEASGELVDDPVGECLASTHKRVQARYVLLHRRDGDTIPIRHSAAAIRSRKGKPLGVALVFHDMTETRSMERQLAYHATHDSLTELINRREFENRLEHALRVAREEHKQHVCLYIDLDQFKLVNDTCGHVAGDELLRQISLLLQGQLRGSDTLARLGGDEFGVLLEGCSLEEGERIAESLRATVREFRFVWTDKGFEIGASIGIVLITAESRDVGAVLSQADVACYAAKDLGRNRIHVYQESDVELARRHGEMQWVSQVMRALEEDRLVLYYQEIQPLGPGKENSAHIEVLLRMRDEQGGLIAPDAFLPAAERYNLMPAVDRWVIRHTFRWYAEHAAGSALLCVVNLSGTSLSDDSFLDDVRALLKASKVPPEAICFEITETAAIANLANAAHFMSELKALGCWFSLDDFGSGLSSFAYLKSLPVDYLKIDGHFVRDMLSDPVDRTMVSAINEVGQSMGLRTIAEYAEDEAIVAELRRLGVDYAQGFGIARPAPLDDLRL
jgi:diguanylate cyclase (GGDEF)-like protein/PAS domain S-box-containing protein